MILGMIGVDTRKNSLSRRTFVVVFRSLLMTGVYSDRPTGRMDGRSLRLQPASSKASRAFLLFPSFYFFALMCLLGRGAKNILTLMDYSAMTTTIPSPA